MKQEFNADVPEDRQLVRGKICFEDSRASALSSISCFRDFYAALYGYNLSGLLGAHNMQCKKNHFGVRCVSSSSLLRM